MTEPQEIVFWKQALKIINKGYGKPCSDFEWGCSGCQANLTASWIRNHIALIRWSQKNVIKKRPFQDV